MHARIDETVRSVFNRVENTLDTLPGGPVANVLECALALVRRTLFNQAPTVTPSVPSTGQDGLIRGRVGAIDYEGDELTYSVVNGPRSGTLSVDVAGTWTFTPGEDYTGEESFTVKIAPETRSVNLSNLRSDGSRVVRINVGDQTLVDAPDVGVYLAGASGRLTVKKSLFNSYTAAVVLRDVTPDTEFKWIDTSGLVGKISLDSLATVYWPQFKAKAADNGATVNLTLSYTGAGGERNAVLLQDVEINQDAAGQYVLSGALAPDPAVNPNGVDRWDVVGQDLKAYYDGFRSTYNIDQRSKFATVGVDFTGADVFADTLTPMSYQRVGMYAQDSEANPQAAGPATGSTPVPGATADAAADSTADATATGNVASVTSSVSDGSTVFIGRSDGTVESWLDGEKALLNDPRLITPVSTAAVNVSLQRGDTLIVARAEAGRVEAWTGNQLTLLTPKPGPSFPANWKGTVNTLLEYDQPVSDTDGTTVYNTGFVAGLSNGAVQLWSDTTNTWVQLRPGGSSGWGSAVTSMINYGDGFVVGLDNGSVQKWNGPGTNSDTSTWTNNWTELQGGGWKSGVTAMLFYKSDPLSFGTPGPACLNGCDGFLVGLANGSVQKYNEATNGVGKPGFKELQGSGWASQVKGFVLSQYGNSYGSESLALFAVGLQNGSVQQWTDFGWSEIQHAGKDGWNSDITSMSQYGQNFVVGLKNGAVEMRVNQGAGNPYNTSGCNYCADVWRELHKPWGSTSYATAGAAVNQIVPVKSADADSGVYVGLQNGSVQLWNGQLSNNSGQGQWTELRNAADLDENEYWGVRTLNQTGVNGGITVGQSDGTLQQWTPQEDTAPQDGWTELTYQPIEFSTTVTQMLTYKRPLKDAAGNQVDSNFTGYILGNKLTVTSLGVGSTVVVGSEITGEDLLGNKVAPGTRITKYIDQSAQCVDDKCDQSKVGDSVSSGYLGVYEVSIDQTVGSSVPEPSPDDPSELRPAGIRINQTGIPAETSGVIGSLADGSVRLLSSDSNVWTTLHDSAQGTPWPGGGQVSQMIAYGEGILIGTDQGAVLQWSGPGKDPDPATWINNWTVLHDDTWPYDGFIDESEVAPKAGVTVLTSFRDSTGLCTGSCDGFVVGLSTGIVAQYNDATGWKKLQGTVWGSPVKGIVLSKYDGAGRPTIAVGLQNGSVQQWTGSGWAVIQRPGKNGWNSDITAMSQFGENFIVGLKNSAIQMRVNPGNGSASTWVELHDAGWGKFGQVNQIVPFKSATIGNGVVVGLGNGSVQLWNGTLPGQSNWTELHDAGWGSAVSTVVLAKANVTDANGNAGPQDGVVVGLANGATEQWTGVITGPTGQNDWVELQGFYSTNYAAQVLSNKEPLACDKWRCSNQGTLNSAVGFGGKLAQTIVDNILYPPEWGTAGGVGGPKDPIFSDPNLQSGSTVNGTYHPFAISLPTIAKALSKDLYTYPDPLKMVGEILPADEAGIASCGQAASDCSVLVVSSVKAPGDKIPQSPVTAYGDPLQSHYWNDGLITGKTVTPDTTIREYLGTTVRPGGFCLGGTCTVFRVSGPPQEAKGDFQIAASPSLRVGIDVTPTIYGYTYVPDSFLPKFKPGNWSIGALAAVKMGPSVTVKLGPEGQIYGPEKDVPLFDFYSPGPLGIDSFSLNSGLKLSSSLTLGGAEKPSVKVYAYTVPGTVFTYNSAGAPGRMQIGVNNYLDFSAADLYNISGISITATATPYLNLTYGILVPESTPVIGGWSLFKLGAGYENPISATACADTGGWCTAGGVNNQANFYGVINDGSFDGRTAIPSVGNVLTVTQAAVLGAQPKIGQVLTGPGVALGTTITRYLGTNGNGRDQYEVAICDSPAKDCKSTKQSSVGGKTAGTHPFLTAGTPGSDFSVTVGALGNLTFHAGVIESVVGQLLSYNAKIPLYNFNSTWSLA